MAGGLTVSVRQIASYPAAAIAPNDLVLVQQGGLGGPYASQGIYTAIREAVAAGGPLAVGAPAPANAWAGGLFCFQLAVPNSGGVLYNAYYDTTSASGAVLRFLESGVAGQAYFENGYHLWQVIPAGLAGAPTGEGVFTMVLSAAGNLSLPTGTLTVARDPASAFEVATAQWVGANTVGSFNGRRGVVTLDACDIGAALGYPAECIATIPQVNEIICQTIQDLIRTYPAVWSFNGRVGDVWLTVDDLNWALGAPGAPPLIIQTPPATAIDGEAVNAQWVITYVAGVLAGPPAYATEPWVLQQITQGAGVTTFNGRSGTVTLQYLDVASLGFAPVNSPSFSGIPSAPTASAGTSSSQIATTAFVVNTLAALSPGVVSFNGRAGLVTLEATDVSGVGGALLISPNFTGTPTSITPPIGDSSQRIATTAFVMSEIAAATAGVSSWNGRSGAVTMTLSDVQAVGGAPVASPGFSGIPTAPTAANGTNTTQLATTAFVQNELVAIGAGVLTFNGRSGNVVFTANDLSAVGGAQLASPVFTGTPHAPTPAPGDSSQNIATTAFVQNAIAGAAVTSFNSRSGAVTLVAADITAAGGALLASPAFTGLPTAPTAAAGNSSTLIATTAFVATALASYLPLAGGVLSGPLTLSGNVSQPLQAVPFQQLQSYVAGQGFATTAQLAGYLPLGGGTLTGNLTISSAASLLANTIYPASGGTVTLQGGLTMTAGLSVAGAATITGTCVAGGFQTGPVIIGNTGFITGVASLTATNGQFNGTLTVNSTLTCNQSGVIAGNLSVGATGGGGGTVTMAGSAAASVWLDQGGTTHNVAARYLSTQLRFASDQLSEMCRMDPVTGNFVIAGTGYSPAGGPWASTSDPRVKTISGNYAPSLAAIMRLQPITFSYRGNDTDSPPQAGESAPYPESLHYSSALAGTSYTGLDAAAVQAVFPECVEEQKGYIDGQEVSDLRILNTGPLLFALINAVIQLGERVQELDGKAAT